MVSGQVNKPEPQSTGHLFTPEAINNQSTNLVSGHLAIREFRHQLTRHQEKVIKVN